MADNAGSLPDRGQTWHAGQTPPTTFAESQNIEGVLKCFDDVDPTTGTNGAHLRRSGRQTTCRFVRNVSGIKLEPKRIVKYKTGFRNKRVDGYCAVTDERCAGVVDEHLATGIPNNDLGWIAVAGPTLVKTGLEGDAGNSIAAEDLLGALTAATSQATTAGRITDMGAPADDTAARNQALNALGYALSAMTTGQTNTDMLVDLIILKDS